MGIEPTVHACTGMHAHPETQRDLCIAFPNPEKLREKIKKGTKRLTTNGH